MIALLANAESVMLVSPYKPVIFLVVVTLWARALTIIDKDLWNLSLNRKLWNSALLAAGLIGLGLWLTIPYFWAGFFVALLFVIGPLGGYVYQHNIKVDRDDAKWNFKNLYKTFASGPAKINVNAQAKAAKRGVTLLNKDGSVIPTPLKEDPLVPIHDLFVKMVEYAVPRRAEKIDMAVSPQKVVIRVQIDGVAYPQPAIEPAQAVALVDYIKLHSKLDVADRRKRQNGQLHLIAADIGKKTFGVLTYGSTQNLVLSLTLDPTKTVATPLKEIGLLEQQMQTLLEAHKQPNGVFIVTAPARHGQTTTLYDLVREHDPYTQSIITFEEQIPVELEGVRHNLLEQNLEADALAQKLQSTFRRDPQVVYVSKVADPKVAQVIADAAEDVRIYIGLPLDDGFTAIRAWVKAVGDPEKAAKSLRCVVAQRLVRKLCTHCRIPYKPDPAALRKLNLPDKVQQLYKHSGQVMVKEKAEPCPACLGLGYVGRIGVFEVMSFDETAHKLIAENQMDQLRLHLRKQKLLLLQEAAVARAVEGITSISEITRALAKEDPNAAAGGAPGNPGATGVAKSSSATSSGGTAAGA